MAEHYEGAYGISFRGLEELTNDLERLIQKYPDKSGDLLFKNAKDFRKQYIRNIKDVVKHKSGSGKSLVKSKNIKITRGGYFGGQYVDIGSISPHFHLFERGHNLIVPQRPSVSGFVEGRHVMEKTINDYEKKLPGIAEKMLNELLKEGNL